MNNINMFLFNLKNKLKKSNNFLWFLITIVVLIFFIQTIFKALGNSCDLMWQPSKLFWQGINHYNYILNTNDVFLGCQYGQYGHFLFILLYPISIFEWENAKLIWIFINSVLVFYIPLLICKNFNISKNLTLVILAIFVSSHPVRMTIYFGQNSLLIFFFIMIPFLDFKILNNNAKYFFSGISYVKYSTGYIIFLHLLTEKKFKYLILSSLISIFSWFFYSYFTGSELLDSFLGPFKIIFGNNYTRTGDIYSVLNLYILKDNTVINKIVIFFIILVLNIYLLLNIKNVNDKLAKLSVISFLPLVFLPHSNYDYVLLLPLLIFGIKNYKFNISKISIYLVIYFFYFNRLIRHWINNDFFYQTFFCILCLIFIIFFINFIKKNYNTKSI